MWERFGEGSEERWGWRIGSGWRFAVLVPPRGENQLISRVRKDLWVPFFSLKSRHGPWHWWFHCQNDRVCLPLGKFEGVEAVNAEEGCAEGISGEAESKQGGSAPCPTMPAGFGDRHVGTRGHAVGSRGL